MPVAITPQQGLTDLTTWISADIQSIEAARSLNGGGGWEQWAIIQFLRWQTASRPTVSYQREYKVKSVRRAFDIAYNLPTEVTLTPATPLILTQWKAKNHGNEAGVEAQKDLGTLQEFRQRLYNDVEAQIGARVPILLLVVILCAEPVNFAGVQSVGPFGNSPIRLYHSTQATLDAHNLV